MLADTFVFLLPFTPNDTLFLGHHFLVVVYNGGCLLVRRGGVSVMVLTALGESTSIFQNSWLIARNTRHNSQVRVRDLRCGRCTLQVASHGSMRPGRYDVQIILRLMSCTQ